VLAVIAGLAALADCTARNPAYQWRVDAASVADESNHASDPPPDAGAITPAADAPSAPDLPAPAPDLIAADPRAPSDPPSPDLSAAIDAPPSPSGLVARWRLDPGAGAGIPDDKGANDGALGPSASWSPVACPSASFADPGSLALDGVLSAATLGTATLPAFEHAKSISLWFHIDAPLTALRKSLLTLADPAGKQSIQLGLDGGKVAVWTWASPDGSDVVASPAAASAGWHHLGYTYDGTTHTLYFNGASVGTSTHPGGTGPIVEALLGTYNLVTDLTERFAGLMDDVRIYNRSLTATEMASLAAGAP
jgi:hypothetical protein